jgi:hypothetical protein
MTPTTDRAGRLQQLALVLSAMRGWGRVTVRPGNDRRREFSLYWPERPEAPAEMPLDSLGMSPAQARAWGRIAEFLNELEEAAQVIILPGGRHGEADVLRWPAVPVEQAPLEEPDVLEVWQLSPLQHKAVLVVLEEQLIAKKIARLLERRNSGSFRGMLRELIERGWLRQAVGKGYVATEAALEAFAREERRRPEAAR